MIFVVRNKKGLLFTKFIYIFLTTFPFLILNTVPRTDRELVSHRLFLWTSVCKSRVLFLFLLKRLYMIIQNPLHVFL